MTTQNLYVSPLKPGTQWDTNKHTLKSETHNFIGTQILLHTLHVFLTAINPAKKSLATPNVIDEEAEVSYVFKVTG